MPCSKYLACSRASAAFDLGLERTDGFQTVAFCEIDPFCQKVLASHWPGVHCYDDIRTLTADQLAADGISPNVLCGGFPCQDISLAGSGAGLAGERSGLWSEYARLIGELRPLYVIVENVAALLGRGLGAVLGDLASLGYDAEWHCIPASAVGAPHRRDRIWIMANPSGGRCSRSEGREMEQSRGAQTICPSSDLADAAFVQRDGSKHNGRSYREGPVQVPKSGNGSGDENVADAEQGRLATGDERHSAGHPVFLASGSCERGRDQFGEAWRVEPDVGRVAYGLPAQMDRLQSLGNAVVPQIPEMIGRAILEAGAA